MKSPPDTRSLLTALILVELFLLVLVALALIATPARGQANDGGMGGMANQEVPLVSQIRINTAAISDLKDQIKELKADIGFQRSERNTMLWTVLAAIVTNVIQFIVHLVSVGKKRE